MMIAQISDTHILSKLSDLPQSTSRVENLRRCVADINQNTVDVVIHTGDTVHQGLAEEYSQLREILSELSSPVLLVPGNRDHLDTLREHFDHFSYLPQTGDFLHYTMEDWPLRLVALDSIEEGERKGVFCKQRVEWLDKTLSENPDRPTLLFMHHPPFDIEPHYVAGYRRQQETDGLEVLVSRHSQVKWILCGHVHCFHREKWAGTAAVTIPSVAVDLRKDADEAIGENPLYVLHEVSEDGKLHTQIKVVKK